MPRPSRPSLHQPRDRRSAVAGFTLIEMLITLVVVAVFSTIAAPSFRQLIANQRLRAATSAVTESLWQARSESVKLNTNVAFTLTKGTLNSGWQVLAGTTVLATKDAYPAVQLDFKPTVASQAYQFNAFGRMAAGANTSIQLGVSNANVYRCIAVSVTGRTEVKEGKC